jgi:rod shape-determining protein MreD
MIMPRGQQILLPANSLFILLSLVFSLLLDMSINMLFPGASTWMPEILMVSLMFWCVHQPRLVGIGVAFVFGVFTDVHQAALLGQHALTYTALGFLAVLVHRRLLWFTVPSQAMQVFPIFLLVHSLELILRMTAGASFPGWSYFFAPVFEAILWPFISVILLAPQRRAPDPDATRPL